MQTKTFRETELELWTQRAGEYDQIFAAVSTQAIDDILDNLGPLRGMRHLDIACGTGHLVGAASKRGAASQGIDFSPAMVETARANYPAEHFQTADALDLPYEDETFDAVSCAFGLSHMEDPRAAVKEIFRVLKPGGRFAFTLWFDAAGGNQVYAILKSALDAHATSAFTLSDQWVQLRFADETACTAITAQAGFERPAFKKLPILWRLRTVQEMADQLMKISIRTRAVIERQPPSDQARIFEHILGSLESHRTNGAITLAWPALLTVVQKPIRQYDPKPSWDVVEKHKLFDSLEEMLAPEALSELLSEPVSSVEIQPMTDHGGLAGGRLYYVDTHAGRFVLKRIVDGTRLPHVHF
jgi:ubiquinone/menaquinone biosynthesis C-methylase UbiE